MEEKKNLVSPQCKSFVRRTKRTEDGINNQACWSAVVCDMEILEENSPSKLFLLDMFSNRADWEGFLLCRC